MLGHGNFCVHASMGLCLCECVPICLYVHVRLCVHACTCVCMWVCVFVSICEQLSEDEL